MELKKGYKNTEVGVIPNDWEVVPIQKYANLINGRAYALHEWKTQGTPVIRLQNLTGNGENYYYSDLKLPEKQYCKFGDLLFMWSATFGAVIWQGEQAIFHYHIWKVETDPSRLDKSLLFHILSELTHRITKSSTNGGTMLHLTKSGMEAMLIPLPSTKSEQTAIATALSDADALITGLEKLIAKKRDIKQGAMQELLSPKEGWVVRRLGEVCLRITTGKLDANAMNVDGDYRFYTCAKTYSFISNYAFDDEALLVSGNGENVGYVHYYKGRFNAYQRTYVLTGFNQNIHYVKLYLDKFLPKRIESEVNAGNTPYIRMGTLTDMQIVFPSVDEQVHIATLLSDMDLELTAIESKLEKYERLKQGMMQNLLTGKIRLR